MCARGKGLLARSITRRQAAQHAQPPVDSFRFPPGVDDSASQGPMPTSARQPPGPGHTIHTVGADCISAQNRVHPTRKCGTGGHTGRPYGPASGLLVGAACMAARTGSDFRRGSMVSPRRGRYPHRPASRRVQGSSPTAHTSIFPAKFLCFFMLMLF